MHVGADGWLSSEEGRPKVVRLPSVRTSKLETDGPLGLVWHCTGGVGGAGFAEVVARRIQTYQAGKDRAASFHVVIARDGAIYQCAPFTVGTWHVGDPGQVAGRYFKSVNRVTVGVELENAGHLLDLGGEFYAHPYYANPTAPAAERRPDPRSRVPRERVVLFSDGRVYDGFPQEQVASATELVRALAARFHWPRSDAAYSHAQFSSPKRVDPGPLWMIGHLPRVLDGVFGPSGDRPPPLVASAPDVKKAKPRATVPAPRSSTTTAAPPPTPPASAAATSSPGESGSVGPLLVFGAAVGCVFLGARLLASGDAPNRRAAG